MPTTLATTPLRVVLADDSPESRALLQATLDTVEGVDVVGLAVDGLQAIGVVAQQQPDLIFLDIAMPVMDGLEAAAAIRAQAPAVKIAVYSGYSRATMGATALAAGADDYVEKAASTAELLAHIHGLFPDRPTPVARPAAKVRRSFTGKRPARIAAERRYQLLLDAMEEGVLTTDSSGRVTEANFVATQILGIPVREMMGRTLAQIGLSGGQAGEAVEDAMRTERPVSNIEHAVTLPDGSALSLLISVRPLHDPESLSVHEALVSFVDQTRQRRTEDRLETAETRLRRSFEAMLDALVVFSAVRDERGVIVDFRYEELNTAACRIYGMSAEEVLGRHMCDVLPARRGSVIFQRYVATVEGGQPLHEAAIDVADVLVLDAARAGQILDLRAVASGEELIVSKRDITEEVRQQARVSASEAMYRQMLETTNEGVWAFDADELTTYVNPTLADMLGYTVDEMLGAPMWDFVSRESQVDVVEHLKVLRNGVSGVHELTLRRRDRAALVVLVSATPTFDDTGAYAGALEMLTDFTERRAAEAELKRLAAVVESSVDAIFSKDASGLVTTWNEGAALLYGYTASEMIGRPGSLLVPVERAGEDERFRARALGGSSVVQHDTTRLAKDGSLREVSVTESPLRDEAGNIVGASAIHRDLSRD